VKGDTLMPENNNKQSDKPTLNKPEDKRIIDITKTEIGTRKITDGFTKEELNDSKKPIKG
jgi:hypothetical protein